MNDQLSSSSDSLQSSSLEQSSSAECSYSSSNSSSSSECKCVKSIEIKFTEKNDPPDNFVNKSGSVFKGNLTATLQGEKTLTIAVLSGGRLSEDSTLAKGSDTSCPPNPNMTSFSIKTKRNTKGTTKGFPINGPETLPIIRTAILVHDTTDNASHGCVAIDISNQSGQKSWNDFCKKMEETNKHCGGGEENHTVPCTVVYENVAPQYKKK